MNPGGHDTNTPDWTCAREGQSPRALSQVRGSIKEVKEKNRLICLKKASKKYQEKGIHKSLLIHLNLLIVVYDFNVITRITLLGTVFSHSLSLQIPMFNFIHTRQNPKGHG